MEKNHNMQAVVLEKVGELSVKTVAIPTCPADGILIKVQACAICATDVKVYRYGHKLIKPPRITGHELAGTVVATGKDVSMCRVGDRIAVAPAVPCGQCWYCRKGIESMCADLTAIGYHYDGGFAEYMVVPPRAIKNNCVTVLPENVSFEEAALTEPLAAILNCQEISVVNPGDTVVIIGGGSLGCLHAWVVRSHGAAKIIVIDLSAERLALSQISKADVFVDASREDAVKRVLVETDGRGANVIIIACSSGKAQEQSLEMVCARGRINFFGSLPKGKSIVQLDSNLIHYKECFVSGTQGSAPRHNKQALELIAKGTVPIRNLITHRLALAEFMQGMNIVEQGKGLKVVILPGTR